MGVISAGKIVELAQASDGGAEAAKKALIRAVGDIAKVAILGDNLFVATYIRPETTKGKIIRPESSIKEDEFQGNIGLILKVSESIEDAGELLNQWVLFGYNDGLRLHYNDVACRIISIGRIRAIIPDPTKVL